MKKMKKMKKEMEMSGDKLSSESDKMLSSDKS